MPDYLTRGDIDRIRADAGRSVYNEKLYAAQRRAPDGLTFLSHSSKDNELVPAVITILEGHGARVYVDTKDPTLQSQPGREVAIQLRSRIQKSRKFIVFVTENKKKGTDLFSSIALTLCPMQLLRSGHLATLVSA